MVQAVGRLLSDHAWRPAGRGPAPDLSNPNSWPLGEVVAERGFTTDAAGNVSYSFDLPVGTYRALRRNAGPFREAGDRRVAAAGSGSGGQELGDQSAASVRCIEVVAPAGRGVFGPVGYGVRQGAGLCRNRASPQAGAKLLDRSGGDPGDDQAVGFRSDAGRLHGSRDHGPRESSVSRIPPRRRSLDQQRSEVRWEHFVSKLQPTQKETWTLVVEPVSPQKRPSR